MKFLFFSNQPEIDQFPRFLTNFLTFYLSAQYNPKFLLPKNLECSELFSAKMFSLFLEKCDYPFCRKKRKLFIKEQFYCLPLHQRPTSRKKIALHGKAFYRKMHHAAARNAHEGAPVDYTNSCAKLLSAILSSYVYEIIFRDDGRPTIFFPFLFSQSNNWVRNYGRFPTKNTYTYIVIFFIYFFFVAFDIHYAGALYFELKKKLFDLDIFNYDIDFNELWGTFKFAVENLTD